MRDATRGALVQSLRRDRRADVVVFCITTSRVRPATVSATTVRVAECDAPRGSRVAALLESRDGALFVRPLEL
jgi:type II secretory pathway predicted ATPase ExeA